MYCMYGLMRKNYPIKCSQSENAPIGLTSFYCVLSGQCLYRRKLKKIKMSKNESPKCIYSHNIRSTAPNWIILMFCSLDMSVRSSTGQQVDN